MPLAAKLHLELLVSFFSANKTLKVVKDMSYVSVKVILKF